MCLDVGDLVVFAQKKSEIELKKRTITLIDHSKKPLIVTLWNLEADNFNRNHTDTIISIKNGQLNEKNGTKYITNTRETIIIHSANSPHTRDLHQWYFNGGKEECITNLSSMALSGFE